MIQDVFFFFFFSSRRRHTRYIGDWSSDVCSSDLQQGGSNDAGSAEHAVQEAGMYTPQHGAQREAEQLDCTDPGENRRPGASGHGEGLALRVVVRRQPRGHAGGGTGTGTDGDQVDARGRDPAQPGQQRPAGEAVLHGDEPAGGELAFQRCAHVLGGERAGEPGNGQLRQEAPIIGHAATSLATRSRSAAATGASGARTGPPYRPPPTASIAAFTPAGPSLATISLSSGTRRSCSFPAWVRSPARNAARMPAHTRAAKHATASTPPSHPSSRAAYSSEPEPTSTDHCGTASRYAARFLVSPDESFTPMILG